MNELYNKYQEIEPEIILINAHGRKRNKLKCADTQYIRQICGYSNQDQ